jgi:hypothetical protein
MKLRISCYNVTKSENLYLFLNSYPLLGDIYLTLIFFQLLDIGTSCQCPLIIFLISESQAPNFVVIFILSELVSSIKSS